MIKVDNLCKKFKDTVAVDHVSFNISSGEVVGFLGPNGAGKTTTMRLLTNYLSPDNGSIRIADVDLDKDPLAARRMIGYLPESAPLYNDLTVIEYLRYFASIRRIQRSERSKRIRKMVDSCGLTEVLNRSVGVLSKGYRQRVGLAQTLLHDPKILILDEATTGLDPNQRVEIRDLIKEISSEKTIIISTHILSEVQATCSRLLIINKGKIVADGSPGVLEEQMKGEYIINICAKGEKGVIESALDSSSFIASYKFVEQENDNISYNVRSVSGGEDPGEAIFNLAVNKGFILTEIRREGVSLENLFASLTLGEVEN